jgi:ABC-type antimicrobial peptide transport system permease subunit
MGAKLLAGGALLGAAVSWLAGIGMKSVLYEVVPYDVGVLLATALALSVVVFLASYLPSSKAARVSPMEAMREE